MVDPGALHVSVMCSLAPCWGWLPERRSGRSLQPSCLAMRRCPAAEGEQPFIRSVLTTSALSPSQQTEAIFAWQRHLWHV